MLLPTAAHMRVGVFRPVDAPRPTVGPACPTATSCRPDISRRYESILDGRDFAATDGDGAPLVAIVSEETARRFWKEQSAIGKRLVLGPSEVLRGEPANEKELVVIGLVGEVGAHTGERERPAVYLPLDQHHAGVLHIVARSRKGSILGDLRRAVTVVDPSVPVGTAQTLDDALAMYQWPQRARHSCPSAWVSSA